MIRPKIAIFKKYVLDAKGHFRFFGANNAPRKAKKKIPIYDMNDDQMSKYPLLLVQTEKQLIEFIRDTYGYGQYMVSAFLKGRKGSFVMWRGEINEDGWIFYNLEYNKNEVDSLRKELTDAENEGDRDMVQMITEMVNESIHDAKKSKATRRYGFAPFLRPSGRRGVYNMWEEPDRAFEEKSKFDRRRHFSIDNMSLDQINELE